MYITIKKVFIQCLQSWVFYSQIHHKIYFFIQFFTLRFKINVWRTLQVLNSCHFGRSSVLKADEWRSVFIVCSQAWQSLRLFPSHSWPSSLRKWMSASVCRKEKPSQSWWIFLSEILKSNFYFKLNLTYKPDFPNQFINYYPDSWHH